jgi:hypothetical protein
MSSSTSTAKRILTSQTHVVENQARLMKYFNFFRTDPSLVRAMGAYEVDTQQLNDLTEFGAQCGDMMDAAERAEKNIPKLKQFDPQGECDAHVNHLLHLTDNPTPSTFLNFNLHRSSRGPSGVPSRLSCADDPWLKSWMCFIWLQQTGE